MFFRTRHNISLSSAEKDCNNFKNFEKYFHLVVRSKFDNWKFVHTKVSGAVSMISRSHQNGPSPAFAFESVESYQSF